MAAGILHSLRRIQPIYGLRSSALLQNTVCVEPRRCAFATVGHHLGDGDGCENASNTPKANELFVVFGTHGLLHCIYDENLPVRVVIAWQQSTMGLIPRVQ